VHQELVAPALQDLQQVELAPGSPANPHSLTREEVFVVLDGDATVEIGGVRQVARRGDAIVVPADVEFALAYDGVTPLRLVCCLPVGGQASLPGGDPFTPPWAFTYLKYASAPRPTDPKSAAGPVIGTVPPIVIVVGVTPGVPPANATGASTHAAAVAMSARFIR